MHMHVFRNTFVLFLGAMPLLVATASAAEEVPRQVDRYSLIFGIRQQARTIAEPRMEVRAGEQTTMTVEDKSSGRGYQLVVFAKAVAHPTGRSGEWLEVSADFSEIQKGVLVHKTQPVLVVPVVADNSPRSQAVDAEQVSMSLVSSSRAQEMVAQQRGKGSTLQDDPTAEFRMTVSAALAAKESDRSGAGGAGSGGL